MSFLYPSLLFFTGLIALPVIIHLFRFRRFRIVYFSNLRYLRDATLETRSRSRLKHLLVLLCRILTLLALVFAFSQPFIPGSWQQENKDQLVALYIDNSYSMQQPGETGSLLEESKTAAIDILQAYPPSTRFIVINNDFEPGSNHPLSKDKAREVIAAIAPSRMSQPFSAISKRTESIASQQNLKTGTVYILSDFQQYGWEQPDFSGDSSTVFVTYKPFSLPANNMGIDTCFFEYPGHYPGSREQLTVVVRNYSGESYQNIPIRLYLNDSLSSVGNISVQPESTVRHVIAFTSPGPGIVHGRIEISDLPVTYDNTLYFSYTISQNIPVSCIRDKNPKPYFDAFFSNDSAFRYTATGIRETDYSTLSRQSLIIVNEATEISDGFAHEMQNYITGGGVLLFVPAYPFQPETINRFLAPFGLTATVSDTTSQSLYSINEQSVLFRNAFQKKEQTTRLPVVGPAVSIRFNPASGSAVASSVSGNPLITEIRSGKGRLYVLSFSLSARNSAFATDPLFVPFLYNMALFSQPAVSLYLSPGETVTAPLEETGEKPVEIQHVRTGNRVIPLQSRSGMNLTLFPDASQLEPGNYLIAQNEKTLGGFSVNTLHYESDNRYLSETQIDSLFKENKRIHFPLSDSSGPVLTRNVQQLSGGVKLWYYFILAAVIFLLAEIILLRRL